MQEYEITHKKVKSSKENLGFNLSDATLTRTRVDSVKTTILKIKII